MHGDVLHEPSALRGPLSRDPIPEFGRAEATRRRVQRGRIPIRTVPGAPRPRFTLAVTLFGLAAISGLFLPDGAFAPGLGHPLTRWEWSYRPSPTSNWEKRPDYEPMVTKYASTYGVRPALVHAIIQRESRGNPLAVGAAGEQGLMQLMPRTAQDLGVRNGFDIEENIRGGVEYLSRLLRQFGDEKKALAAYNTGPGTVSREGITPRGHAYALEILTNARELR